VPARKQILFTLMINGVIPWLLYVLLSDVLGSLAALSVATLFPLVDTLAHLLRHRKLDAFGSLMLFTFLLTISLVAFGGSEKLLLVRESLVTAAVGLVFLVSLAFPKPLIFHLAVRFIAKPDFASGWQHAYFRFVMRLMTFVWGVLLTGEAAVRVWMAFRLSTKTYLALSNVVLWGFIGAAILWTIVYRRHSAAKFNRIKHSAL